MSEDKAVHFPLNHVPENVRDNGQGYLPTYRVDSGSLTSRAWHQSPGMANDMVTGLQEGLQQLNMSPGSPSSANQNDAHVYSHNMSPHSLAYADPGTGQSYYVPPPPFGAGQGFADGYQSPPHQSTGFQAITYYHPISAYSPSGAQFPSGVQSSPYKGGHRTRYSHGSYSSNASSGQLQQHQGFGGTGQLLGPSQQNGSYQNGSSHVPTTPLGGLFPPRNTASGHSPGDEPGAYGEPISDDELGALVDEQMLSASSGVRTNIYRAGLSGPCHRLSNANANQGANNSHSNQRKHRDSFSKPNAGKKSNYKVHSSSEFSRGKVLKCNWPEPHGRDNKRPASSGAPTTVLFSVKKNDIFSKDRRFIIVNSFKGHSICVPILTYGVNACTKNGVHPEHHGIIYDTFSKPQLVDGEPELGFESIAMEPLRPTERLLPESRVNYAKCYTVEHNTEVVFVGQVVDECLEYLIESARSFR